MRPVACFALDQMARADSQRPGTSNGTINARASDMNLPAPI